MVGKLWPVTLCWGGPYSLTSFYQKYIEFRILALFCMQIWEMWLLRAFINDDLFLWARLIIGALLQEHLIHSRGKRICSLCPLKTTGCHKGYLWCHLESEVLCSTEGRTQAHCARSFHGNRHQTVTNLQRLNSSVWGSQILGDLSLACLHQMCR